jgi:predicted ArsR family transcriptional regulator
VVLAVSRRRSASSGGPGAVTVGELATEVAGHAQGGLRKIGRTPKVYQPLDADIRISIPERQPDVLASILMDAVLTERVDETARQAAMRAAHERGQRVAATGREQLRPGRLGAERALSLSEGLLKRHGYDPDRLPCWAGRADGAGGPRAAAR